MISKIERTIAFRYLKPKKKEGFLKIISIFSFLGIMLGVAILIIVMSVMNGFKTDLTKKILGLNPHIVIESNGFKIENEFIENNIRYIVPSIKGSAFITGQQELYVSSDDPFPEGYKLNDTWPQNIL